MGRTLPTQIWLLRQAEEEWKGFRRALRKEDQDAFDAVWSFARRHSVPASMAARALPFEAHALGMIIGLYREMEALKNRFEEKTTTDERSTGQVSQRTNVQRKPDPLPSHPLT